MRISRFAAEFGLSPARIENWIRRGIVRRPLPDTVAGRAYELSESDVLEIALVGALIGSGYRPKEGGEAASALMVAYAKKPAARFVLISVGSHATPQLLFNSPSAAEKDQASKMSPYRTVAVIDLSWIHERVRAIVESECN